jgi:hypothetical protein
MERLSQHALCCLAFSFYSPELRYLWLSALPQLRSLGALLDLATTILGGRDMGRMTLTGSPPELVLIPRSVEGVWV